MENIEIRQLIEKNSFKHYQVAQEIGISSFTFSVWMRTPLTEMRKRQVVEAIERLMEN